jgi:type IV secretion/conjugal transfer VirB4 family ATPase
MLNLREFKGVPDRLTDYLPWAALIDPTLIVNKDGSFLSVIKYRGPDLDSCTEEELMVKSAHLNNVLKRLDEGWALYAEAKRETTDKYPEPNFSDPIAALIDAERASQFKNGRYLHTTYYLTLIYLPPEETQTKLTAQFLNGNNHEKKISYQTALENYKLEVKKVLDLIEKIYPETYLLKDDTLLTYLHSTISSKNHIVKVPTHLMYIDAQLADTPLTGGFYPKLGEHYLGTIALMSFPQTSEPAIFDALNQLPIEYRWVTRYIPLSKLEAKKEIETFQKRWFSKRKGIGSLIKELFTKEESLLTDHEATAKASDAQEALSDLGTDQIGYGFYTNTIILKNSTKEELQSDLGVIEKTINGLGFTCKQETVNAVDAFLGTIPGNVRNNVRRPIINSLNLAHLFPGSSAAWLGQSTNKHLKAGPLMLTETSGCTPFNLSLHVGDVGHTLILGPTGSGKSTLLNFISAQFLRYKNAQIYVFDKGCSSFPLTAAMGGDYYTLGAKDCSLSFQPLANIDDESEMQWAFEWLCGIAEKDNLKLTPELKRSIWESLSLLASNDKPFRTLHTFTVYLQSPELRAVFAPYTMQGAYGTLLDSDHEVASHAKWQCYEMQQIMETPSLVAPLLSYIFHQIERSLKGAPTLIILDEAWLFLDHPVFAKKIREWLKILRKLNASVIFATQSLADIDSSSIAPTIKEACFTKIYLPNPIATQPDSTEFYRRFGLNERQIEMLAYAMPKRDYYYTSPLGNRLFNLALGELALAICANASAERTALVRRILQETTNPIDFNIRLFSEIGLTWVAQELVDYKEERLQEAA